MKAKIVTHYAKDDKKFSGDYYGMELYIDGKLVLGLSDSYHDKSDIKIEAFLDGIRFTGQEITVEKVNKADFDD